MPCFKNGSICGITAPSTALLYHGHVIVGCHVIIMSCHCHCCSIIAASGHVGVCSLSQTYMLSLPSPDSYKQRISMLWKQAERKSALWREANQAWADSVLPVHC